MAIEAETKDCNAVTEEEIEELMLVAGDEGALVYTAESLGEELAKWVLVTLVRDGSRLHAFSTCTLERVGGTPAVLMGVGAVRRTTKRNAAMKALVGEQMRRAVLAFPDEDVLVGARVGGPGGLESFASFPDVVPRPGHDASGEDRAWGTRLFKRFSPAGDYAKREFKISGSGSAAVIIDHEALDAAKVKPQVAAMFDGVEPAKGDAFIVFSWAMAEYLEKLLP
jgi:hypothetical protein